MAGSLALLCCVYIALRYVYYHDQRKKESPCSVGADEPTKLTTVGGGNDTDSETEDMYVNDTTTRGQREHGDCNEDNNDNTYDRFLVQQDKNVEIQREVVDTANGLEESDIMQSD